MCALIEASDPSGYQSITPCRAGTSDGVSSSARGRLPDGADMPHLPNGNHGTQKAFRGRAARERRLALNPPARPERGRGGRETFCRLVAAARTPAAQRVGRRLQPPHAGACRAARDCVPNRGHFLPTLRASPWCPIRPRVSRGDCLRGSFTFSARHPQTARPYPGPRTQYHVTQRYQERNTTPVLSNAQRVNYTSAPKGYRAVHPSLPCQYILNEQ